MIYLVGDIGGTKTHLALIEKEKELKILKEEIYPSREFSSLESVIDVFVKNEKKVLQGACFGVAGPVRDQVCRATNLPWIIDGINLGKKLKAPTFLLNDLEANAYGIEVLSPEEFYVLHEGDPSQKGNRAILSAGTGLGEAAIFWNENGFFPSACEGGHTDFACLCKDDVELFLYLHEKYGHVSYERVVSGPGLYHIYRFLIDVKKWNPAIAMTKGDKEPEFISEKALRRECPVCEKALEWFIRLYGAEAGNVALKFFALGGVYLGGGIAPKILEELKKGGFLKAFSDKGRFASLLLSIPVKIILNEKAALLGAAHYVSKKQESLTLK